MMPAMRPILALLALVIAFAVPAAAKDKYAPGDVIEGPATPLDGDTLRLFTSGAKWDSSNDTVRLKASPGARYDNVRLWGISAPEMDAADGSGWAARVFMEKLTLGRPVKCTVVDTDRHGRPVAVCVDGHSGDDLGESLIRWGWATVYRTFVWPPPTADLEATAQAYEAAEDEASDGKRGRWKRIWGE